MRVFFLVICIGCWCTAALGAPISFQRDVRPILSDKCFKCHGPDSANQKSDFRIDSFEEATKEHEYYTGIVPGDLEASEVHYHIHTDDPVDMMPPPEAKMPLTAEEKAIISQWIEEGANYEKLWSLVDLPAEVAVPEVATDGELPIAKSTNPIDRFVYQKIDQKGLQASAEVSKEKWLRRVTFDLTGLPPTLAELDAFLADQSPQAYEVVVDRLLSSVAYAERMTVEWLDVARYSDTYGYQVDRNRYVYPWRNWVVRAFQENKPYDQFITEQIAGDLLPNATSSQIQATTFNRLHSQKVEGGSVEEEFRIEYVADRVHTVGTAFLGLTMECTRCHDHKYDPLTARDYYALSAFFANIDESGLYSYFTSSVPTPTLELPSPDQEKRLKHSASRISSLENQLAAALAASTHQADVKALAAANTGMKVHLSFEAYQGHKLANSADDKNAANGNGANKIVPGKVGNALQLTGDHAVNLPKGVGNFTRDQPFSYALWLNMPDTLERGVVVRRSKAWTDAASRGYELLIEEGKLSAALIHFWPGNAIRVKTKEPLTAGQWYHVAVTYDGSSRAAGLRLYLDGQLLAAEINRDNLSREIIGGGDDFVGLGQRMRDKGFKNGLVDEFRVYDRELSGYEVSLLNDPAAEPSDTLAKLYVAHDDPVVKDLKARLKTAREDRSAIQKKVQEIMVMREKPGEPREVHVLNRGLYSDRGEVVQPDVPAALPPLQVEGRADRLDLAKWLTMDSHPLTARVTVNRYWQMMFGTGLVSTSEDFGSQGKLPTHPELLDWLARDFIAHGWDLHHLLKQMALSATYRQRAEISSDHRERDPENQFLARSPTYKLPAEMIRDNALAISGLMVNSLGSNYVHPYDLSQSFKPSGPSGGDGVHRRSLYTFWKRTGPSPLMMTLDSSKKDVCRVKREETASPLQSLVLLNSPQFIEAARVTAEALLEKHGADDAKIVEDSFRMLTSRQPDAREQQILLALVKEQIDEFSQDPKLAEEYFKTGTTAPKSVEEPARLAATTVLVSSLMNFDESFTKR